MTAVNDVAAGRQFKTSDRGMHPFPEHCPAWCDRQAHLEFAGESEGCYDAAEITAHFRYGGDQTLDEIRNCQSREVRRDGAGSWSLTARQTLQEPWLSHSGYASPPLVELLVQDRGLGDSYKAAIGLTTGEARVLAAHLVALCDRVDLPRGLQR